MKTYRSDPAAIGRLVEPDPTIFLFL